MLFFSNCLHAPFLISVTLFFQFTPVSFLHLYSMRHTSRQQQRPDYDTCITANLLLPVSVVILCKHALLFLATTATCRISTGTSQHYARSQAGPALLRAASIYSWFPPAIYRAPGSSLRGHDGLFKSIGRFSEFEVSRNLAKKVRTHSLRDCKMVAKHIV
jgi:hypothetical protein